MSGGDGSGHEGGLFGNPFVSLEPEGEPTELELHSDASPAEKRAECVAKFSRPDSIMEPGIFNQLKLYFESGGNPEEVINLLSGNYCGYPQVANLMMEMIILAGGTAHEVRQIVENILQSTLFKTFDPKKADAIFNEEGENLSWLTEMIQHRNWRALVCQLANQYPDCLMLNFTIKLISDAGYGNEITSISTAGQQPAVFHKILQGHMSKILQSEQHHRIDAVNEAVQLICRAEHTLIYTCILFHHLIQSEVVNHPILKRLTQELLRTARAQSRKVLPFYLALNHFPAQYPIETRAVKSMLNKNALNAADLQTICRSYSSSLGNDYSKLPPLELIRFPEFLELLTNALFKPGLKINPERNSRYLFALACATSVYNVLKEGVRVGVNHDELKSTIQTIEKAQAIIYQERISEIKKDIVALFQCIRTPCVAMGVLYWLHQQVTKPGYFRSSKEQIRLHCVILDEIVSCHPLQHQNVYDLMVMLLEMEFEDEAMELELDVALQQHLVQVRKMLIDRLIFLVARGFVLPVVNYMRKCLNTGNVVGENLIRYFVAELLDVMSPPYTSTFVELFLPLVENSKSQSQKSSASAKIPPNRRKAQEEDERRTTELLNKFIAYCQEN